MCSCNMRLRMNDSPTPLLFVSFSPTPARGGDDIHEMTTLGGKASSSILFPISALPSLTPFPIPRTLPPRSVEGSNLAPNSFDDAFAPAELQRPAERCAETQSRPGQGTQSNPTTCHPFARSLYCLQAPLSQTLLIMAFGRAPYFKEGEREALF